MKSIKPIDEFDREDPLKPVGDEPAKASQALLDYALMGASRSLRELLKCYQIVGEEWAKNKPREFQRPPTTRLHTLENYSVKYRWQERVKAYDELLRLNELRDFEADRKKWREHRLKAAKNLLIKAVVALNLNDLSNANLAQIARAMQTAMNALRVEFGEERQLSTANDLTIRVIREDKAVLDDDDAG
jgi:hypothetical protein